MRTATGSDAETLNWVAWDVEESRGQARADRDRRPRTPAAGATSSPTTSCSPTRRPAPLGRDGGQPPRRRRGRAQHDRQGERGARLGELERRGPHRQGRADPDRRPQQRRLGPRPGRPVHVRRRARAVGRAALPAGSTTARTSTPRSPGTTCPTGGGSRSAWMNNWQYANADPDVAVAQRDERAARARAAHDRRPRRSSCSSRCASCARCAAGAVLPPAPPDDPGGHARRCPRAARRSRSRPSCGSATAERAGLKVRTGDGEETVIGYDADAERALRRPHPLGRGRTSAATSRASSARRSAARHGKVRLRILVDWSSVEVFADRGQRVITDQVFPARDQRRRRAVRRGRQRDARLADDPAAALQLVRPRLETRAGRPCRTRRGRPGTPMRNGDPGRS